MGLDIILVTEIESDKDISENFYNHSLSREFCNLMCRKNIVDHQPELDKIGEITGIDISCFYSMENYPNNDDIEMSLEFAENEKEKQSILEKTQSDKDLLTGNIDLVLNTLNQLIEKLESIENLFSLLKPTVTELYNSEYYFSDFKKDLGNGYIDNNFGQDLRNFKRFVENAKSNNNKTIWFEYG